MRHFLTMNTSIETTSAPNAQVSVETISRLSDVSALLTKHPFFNGLNPHHIRLLTDCSMPIYFQPGELIFREGDPANRFYLIQEGKVALESYVKDLGNTLVQMVGAGEVLGWSWLFPPYYWHFDARATEPTKAIFLYGAPLREECETDHDLGYELIKRMAEVMMRRLQATRRHLLDLNATPGQRA